MSVVLKGWALLLGEGLDNPIFLLFGLGQVSEDSLEERLRGVVDQVLSLRARDAAWQERDKGERQRRRMDERVGGGTKESGQGPKNAKGGNHGRVHLTSGLREESVSRSDAPSRTHNVPKLQKLCFSVSLVAKTMKTMAMKMMKTMMMMKMMRMEPPRSQRL